MRKTTRAQPVIRLLSKPAYAREIGGDSERRTGVYTRVHEDSSTESMNKFSAEVGFGKKSIARSEATRQSRHRSLLFLDCFVASLLAMTGCAALADTQDTSTLSETQKFSTVINDIQKYYVYPETKTTLLEKALQGMLSGLDPHSTYLDPEDWQNLQETTQGTFAGIGIEVTMKNGLVNVITPVQGSPAEKAGIKPNDVIIRLNGSPLEGLTLRMALDKLRGPQGSTVSLDIMRGDNPTPLNFVLTREIIQIQSAHTKLFDNNYGYIQLGLFQSSTPKEIITAIETLKKQAQQGLMGLILDLRDNPGGLMKSAVAVADVFIDGKTDNSTLIVYTKGRGPWAQYTAFASPNGDMLPHVPIIVLINEGTASGAEILAGALKDNHRALLLGEKTFGKGSIQTVIPLDDNSAIRLTTALYYTPSGVSIQAKGITPDITVQQITLSSKDFIQNAMQANNLSESDLQGHLVTTPSQSSITNNTKENDALMANDYQLYQALTVLKGMVLTNKMLND